MTHRRRFFAPILAALAILPLWSASAQAQEAAPAPPPATPAQAEAADPVAAITEGVTLPSEGAVPPARDPHILGDGHGPRLKWFEMKPATIQDGNSATGVLIFDRTGYAQPRLWTDSPGILSLPRAAGLKASDTRVEFEIAAFSVERRSTARVFAEWGGEIRQATLTIEPSLYYDYTIRGEDAWRWAEANGFRFAPFARDEYHVTYQPFDGRGTLLRHEGPAFGHSGPGVLEDVALVDRNVMATFISSDDEDVLFHMFFEGADPKRPKALAQGWKVRDIALSGGPYRWEKRWKRDSNSPFFAIRLKRDKRGPRADPPPVVRIESLTLRGPKDANPREAFGDRLSDSVIEVRGVGSAERR